MRHSWTHAALLLSAGVVACSGEIDDRSADLAGNVSELVESGVTATLKIESDWGTGFCASVTLANTSTMPVSSWRTTIARNGSTIANLWNGTVTTSGDDTIVSPSYNASIASRSSVSFGFCGSGSGRPTLKSFWVTGGSAGTGSSPDAAGDAVGSPDASAARDASGPSVSPDASDTGTASDADARFETGLGIDAGQAGGPNVTLQEDDRGLCFATGAREAKAGNYTGPGYLASARTLDADAAWLVKATQAGTYKLRWRYADEVSSIRNASLWLGHKNSGRKVAFAATTNGSTWTEISVDARLEAGDNFIRLQADTVAGLPSIDWLKVEGSGVASSDCRTYAPGAARTFVAPRFTNVSVHDPSIVRSGDAFYVFGSHLAAAKTTDFMNWSMIANGVNANNPLFDDAPVELRATLTWAQSNTLWAADVRQLRSGDFLFYYNACKGDSPLSAMGIARSPSVTGPFRDQGIILRSGMAGTSEDGTRYDGTKHPNAVDPAAFYDASGKMWLSYGSFSGGIFMLALNPDTGFPLPGQGYGKHIMGGNHGRMEGTFVLYDPRTQYYFMFITFGGLGAEEGYNIRVVRSKRPDGPYLDSSGRSVETVRASRPFDDASLAPYAVKLMGNFQYTGDWAAFGYKSPGHNSAYYDAGTGRYYLVFHTRFPGRGEAFEDRVHELFINEDQWPVAAPLRFAPRTSGPTAVDPVSEYVAPSEVAGDYQTIDHGKATTNVVQIAMNVRLGADGRVTGGRTGTWRYVGQNKIQVTVEGRGLFKGVLSRQYNTESKKFHVTFTALNANGESLWGVRAGS